MNIEKISVSLTLGTNVLEVGELVQSERKIFFKYYPSFLETGLLLSPFKLPLTTGVLEPDTRLFEGLFGVFYDSLPDGWGRLLMDRALLSNGRRPEELSPLDRVALVGHSGMGALCYDPVVSIGRGEPFSFELDVIAAEVQRVLLGTDVDAEGIESLVQWGGSSAGARPKILVGYHPGSDRVIPHENPLPAGYEPWLIKFPSSFDPVDVAEIEFAYHLMAVDAGIEMSQCRLFSGATERAYFGTRRFDRVGNQRLHLHSASGLLHDNFRMSNMDYGHLMDAAFRLERHVDAYHKVLRLAAFNVYAHNRDDHSKNTSFLMDEDGQWRLAPAYDLTFSSSGHGHHSTTISGESKTPGMSHLMKLAKLFGITDAPTIIDSVKSVLSQWPAYASTAGVSKSSTAAIGRTINSMLKS